MSISAKILVVIRATSPDSEREPDFSRLNTNVRTLNAISISMAELVKELLNTGRPLLFLIPAFEGQE